MNKLPVFEWFYQYGDTLVTVATQMDVVDVPPQFRNQQLTDFILGRVPTPHMIADEKGITAPMRFGGALYNCVFPWESVVQIGGANAVIQFKSDVLAATPTEGVALRPSAPVKKQRPNLRVVK